MPFFLRDDFAPGTIGNVCSLCGAPQRRVPEPSGPREAIVDPQATIGDPERPGYFPLQFCESCCVEMGRLVGMVTPTDIAEARDAAATAIAAADQLRAERDDLRSALDSLMRAGVAVLTDDEGGQRPLLAHDRVIGDDGKVGQRVTPRSQRTTNPRGRTDV